MASNKKKAAPQKQEVSKQAAAPAAKTPSKADAKAAEKAAKAKAKAKAQKNAKPGFIARAKNYFAGVRTEVKRVVWPTREELVKYSVAVVVMLIFFGLLIYLVDSAIVPLLVAFTGLRG